MAALTLIQSDLIFAALDLFRNVVTNDCFSTSPPDAKDVPFISAIKTVLEKEGFEFVGYLLGGLVGDFPEDSTSSVVSIFRSLATLFPSELLVWLPPLLQHLPVGTAPNESKQQFLADVSSYVCTFVSERGN